MSRCAAAAVKTDTGVLHEGSIEYTHAHQVGAGEGGQLRHKLLSENLPNVGRRLMNGCDTLGFKRCNDLVSVLFR